MLRVKDLDNDESVQKLELQHILKFDAANTSEEENVNLIYLVDLKEL